MGDQRSGAPHTVSVLLFDGVNAIDVAGPIEAFACARDGAGQSRYQVTTFALDRREVTAESGLGLRADCRLPATCCGHTLLVPGGAGVREAETLGSLAVWLRANHRNFQRLASVCTGAQAMAEAGLLDGRTATTHWAHADQLQQRYPLVHWDSDALFASDGDVYTSGGVTAGIDLALHLISDDCGQQVASAVARELVLFLRRSGKQSQFSPPLRLQVGAPDALSSVCQWAAANPQADLSVEELARRAGMSTRHFSRRFRAAYGESPGKHIRRVRIDAARELLEAVVPAKQAASNAGFHSVDGFTRAFMDEFGVSPREYQSRFGREGQALG